MEIMRKMAIDTENILVGDQIKVSLTGLGTFTATAHKVTDEGVLFIFDNYVVKRPMNKTETNEGGFEASDLKKWMDTELINMFPDKLKNRITGLAIPSAGELFGHKDKWNEEVIEQDTDEQLLLMKKIENRASCYNNKYEPGWLKNALKKKFSTFYFAGVGDDGGAGCDSVSTSLGVRPEFWIKPQNLQLL